jgi:hypothetical protein
MSRFVELLADFCRWRARLSNKRAKKAIAAAGRWLQRERSIINEGLKNGEKEERRDPTA